MKMDKEREITKSEISSLSESIWKKIPNTNFMKILLTNIIENVNFLVNIYIGIFVIIRHDYGERNFIYGLGLLILPFMINFLITLNESFYKTELVQSNGKYNLIKMIVLVCLLQHLPFLLFLMTMCGLDFQENHTRRLTNVNLRRSIIYSSLNNIALLFLILRGVITWDNKTCLVDELGRSACIIYPVILTIVNGISITVIHLHKIHGLDTYSTPIALIVIIYRTISFSLIISFLDFWSIIPIVIIILICNVITINSENQNNSKREKDEVDGDTGLVWDGDEWVGLQTPIDLNLSKIVIKDKLSNTGQNCPIISTIINVFCFSNYKTKSFTLVNFLIMIILLVMMYLVNINLNFNYEYNILDNSSFNLLCSLLLFFDIIVVILGVADRFLKSLCNNVFLAITLCLVIINILPFTLFLNKHLTQVFRVYFFTITNTNNTNQITLLEEGIYAGANFDGSNIIHLFQADQIKFNPKYLSKKKTLVFCDALKYCTNKNHNLNFVINNGANNVRSSSPKIFLHKNQVYLNQDFDVKKVLKMANSSNILYITFNEPNENIFSTILMCSNERNIKTKPIIDNFDRCDSTYLKNGKVFQTKCISMNDKHFKVEVQCKTINSNFKLILNSSNVPKHNFSFLNGMSNDLCCLNNSHSVSFYGNCEKYKNLSFLKSNSLFYIKANSCLKHRFLQHLAFLELSPKCFVHISYFTKCYNLKIFDYNCEVDLLSCRKIVVE